MKMIRIFKEKKRIKNVIKLGKLSHPGRERI